MIVQPQQKLSELAMEIRRWFPTTADPVAAAQAAIDAMVLAEYGNTMNPAHPLMRYLMDTFMVSASVAEAGWAAAGLPGDVEFSVQLTGLTDGDARVGDHASLGYTIDPDNGTETVKWSNSSNPADAATYGTGSAPTDYAAGDEGLLYLHVTDGGETATRSAPIRYAPGTAPAVADQSAWTVDDTSVNVDGSASGTGLTFSYAVSGLPAGVDINPSTGAITGTPTAVDSGTATITATDQYGRTLQDTFDWSNELRAQATGGADLDLSFQEDAAISATDLVANWTTNGNTLTYVSLSPALPAGLGISSSGTMTGTPSDITADDTYTLTMEDEYGRETTDDLTMEITAVPSEFFLATFTDDDETTIAAYTPDVPAGGYAGGNTTGAWHIHGNAFASEDRTQATGQADYAAWDLGATPPTEYTISADIRVFDLNRPTGIGLMLCSPDGSIQSDDCYFFNFFAEDLYLDQRSSGSYGSNLGTDTSVSVTAEQLHELKVEVTPTNLVCYLDDVEIFDVSNSARRGRYFGLMTYDHDTSQVAADAPLMDNLQVVLPEPPTPPGAAGGFVEDPLTATPRAPLNDPVDLAAFLPADRGEFTFPAPYNTLGVRLTNTAAQGFGTTSVRAHGYSYWSQINNHVGSNEMKILVGLDTADGGVSIVTYNKVTGVVSDPEPMFDPPSGFNPEGMYFSKTDPDMVYLAMNGNALIRYDISTLPATASDVIDVTTEDSSYAVNQAHSSADDNVHSMTIRENSGYTDVGYAVYVEDADTFTFYTIDGAYMDEVQIDKSGGWLLTKEDIDASDGEDNKVIDLSDDSVRNILDPDGAGGHSDNGYGAMVAAHNYNFPGEHRLWDFTQAGALSSTQVYRNTSWAASAPNHISWWHADDSTPLVDQYIVGSSAYNGTEVHANEIIAVKLDGSRDTLVIAPTMADMTASGGGSNYYKVPKACTDITGEWVCWTSNLGGDSLDYFLARIPADLLTAN